MSVLDMDVCNLGEMTCGVPQGSCPGPLLFITYVNDLPLSIKHSQVNMYADDTSLSFSSKNIFTINERVRGPEMSKNLACRK